MTYWVEEHLWTKEALISYINVNHVAVNGLVHKVLELFGLSEPAIFVRNFLIILLKLFEYIFADISVFLLDFAGNLSRIFSFKLFAAILQHLKRELSDVSACKGDALNTASNYVAVTNWENVRDTIAGIDNSARQVTCLHLFQIGIGARQLCKQSQRSLYADK